MIKYNIIDGYQCCVKKCSVKKTWCRKPIQLLLNHKNNKFFDLRITNLELICPNCYMQNYGLEMFLKK